MTNLYWHLRQLENLVRWLPWLYVLFWHPPQALSRRPLPCTHSCQDLLNLAFHVLDHLAFFHPRSNHQLKLFLFYR